jgi:hypothetical protein
LLFLLIGIVIAEAARHVPCGFFAKNKKRRFILLKKALVNGIMKNNGGSIE